MTKVARLLEQIIPERYVLDIDVDMENFRFTGREVLTFTLVNPSRTLVFHALAMEVTEAKLRPGGGASSILLDEDAQTVTFTFDEELAAGGHVLEVAFGAEINDTLHGFYRSRYTHDGQEKSLVTTQFESTSAREAFVCIDEPSAKAVFEVNLVVPKAMTAISNTKAVKTALAGAGRKRVSFEPSPKMSTYLLAYLVGEFEYVEGSTAEGVRVRAYATPGQKESLEFSVEVAARTLSFYTKYFGIPYPLSKLDMIAVPDFAVGAMENWGAVTYRDTALLLDPAKTSLANKQRVVLVVAHELAHQWFGNLVTMAWWDDLWLNEGFATWVETLAMDELFPEWQAWEDFVSSNMAYAMELDGLANTHPIQVEVDDPRSLDEIFDAISYSKGASIINMLHQYLGAETFRKGLQVYLDRHQYANTVTGDLWTALAETSGKPVQEVMSAWTSRPGHPIISIEEGRVQQRRFYSSPREAKKAVHRHEPWPIPFSALLPDGSETPPVLDTDEIELSPEIMTSEWFKPNPGQTAFFRTLYTEPMIEALQTPLRDRKLSGRDRFGVVNDVFAATEAGLTKSTVALKLVAGLRNEPDYVVWGALTGGLASLIAVVEDEDLRDQLDRFGVWLVEPNVTRLGWEAKPNESSFDTLMRPLILQQAVRFENEAVTAEAKQRFEDYLQGAPIDPELRPAVLYAAARHGGVREFDAILERYRTETSPQVKMSLLAAMGRFHDPAMIDRFLQLGISPDVRPQDIFMVLAWGFRNRKGRDATWAFMKHNWELFLSRYGKGGHMLERFPSYAADGFATHQMAAEIKEFFETHAHPSTKRPTAQAVEAVELKADWYDRDKAEIAAFLNGWNPA